jgi:hypothetical protein
MISSLLSPEDRRRLAESPAHKHLARLTLIFAGAFAMVPVIMGVVIYVLRQQEIIRTVVDLKWLQNPALILCGIITLGIIVIVPKIVGRRLSTRLSTVDPTALPLPLQSNTTIGIDPHLITIYIVSFAALEFPLLPVGVGTLVAGFDFQAYLLAAGAFLFGLAYLVFAVRPLMLQAHLQALARIQPQV